MKKLLLILVLFGLIFNQVDAQRNFAAKKLLFSQVQKPYINYGYLYNWWAAADSRNIANTGWSIPTQDQYKTLADYLGAGGDYTSNLVGNKLKVTRTIYWTSENVGTNSANFNAKGQGVRVYTNGSFTEIRVNANYWTSVERNSTTAWVSDISATTATFSVWRFSNKPNGQGIRIVKDTTTLTDGQTGTYTGNDGKIYRTICIGTQEWLADNLAETKYRNGDWITGYDGGVYTPISNATWGTLTTEAMCVYGDNESYR